MLVGVDVRGSVRRKHSAIRPRVDCAGVGRPASFLRVSAAVSMVLPLGVFSSVGLGWEVKACWDSSSITHALVGGSMVGRPMREWRTEAMWWSVKRRMQLKRSSLGECCCGVVAEGGADLSLEVEAMVFVLSVCFWYLLKVYRLFISAQCFVSVSVSVLSVCGEMCGWVGRRWRIGRCF